MQKREDEIIYENEFLYITQEISSIPWLKIFSKQDCKELSECDKKTKESLFDIMDKIEKVMISYYKPQKINIAMFGNYLPKLHIHIMARFKEDSHFPEPMWGKKQRDAKLNLPDFNEFKKMLLERL